MTKYQIDGWENLEWNGGEDWAIPLPLFPEIRDRWFVPAEAPVIPTGWLYRLPGGELISEYRLWCRTTELSNSI